MPPPNAYLIHRPSYQQPPILVRDHHHLSPSSHHYHDRHHDHHVSFPSHTTQLTALTTLTSTYTRLSTELTNLVRENYSLGSQHSSLPSQSPPGLRSAIEKLSEMVHKIQRKVSEAAEENRVLQARVGHRVNHAVDHRGVYIPPRPENRGMTREQMRALGMDGRGIGDTERERVRERARERRRRGMKEWEYRDVEDGSWDDCGNSY